MVTKLVLGAFLVAHALIHLGFVSSPPAATANGPAWPFDLGRSVVLGPLGLGGAVVRAVGAGLVAVVLGAFAVAALGVVGIAPTAATVPAALIGAAASLVLLVAFFHPWLVLGIAIDAVLLWLLLIANWQPSVGA